MKICYFADAQSIHTQRWVKHFAKRGHEVHLISFKNAEIENVNVHYIGPLIPIPYFSVLGLLILKLRQIKKLIKTINPDIVHGHYLIEHGFYAAVSGFKPLIVSAWGSDVLVSPKNFFINKLILEYTLRKSDIIHIESELMKNEIERYDNSLDIDIIPWGTNTNMFNIINPNFNKDTKNMKEGLSLNNSPVIISTRPFSPIYDIETLVRAIPYVIEKVPNTKFILKGHEPRASMEQFKEKLIKLTRNLNISEFVRFVGETEYVEIPKYLNASDIYVSTSLSDSCSISLLEAMACGLPVVVSDEPSNFEWIKDGWNGYIFPRKDHKALAEKLIMLLKDKEKRLLFGKRNREIIEKRGDWNKNMEKVEQLYENLIYKYQK